MVQDKEAELKKAEKTQLMKERILEGAIQEISGSGYQGFRINQLCKKYGFSKGSLYSLLVCF
ncbi:TetR/AcrR family transcriptional regulator [Streptococcus sp. 121]|uniref:TetR/AcrR family transcriptional regulator n=1 Tax=Streptococcus sp. 121 TaxID=2797637 RepID=UPI001F187B2C|nr:TetR/AcrR family transcriptional regulator [Streptococcus sp. 121]